MFRIFRAETAHEMEHLRSRWESCKSAAKSISQTFLWAQMAALVFSASEVPCVVAAENDSGLAIIPATRCLQGGELSLLGEKLFDYRDVMQEGDPGALQRAWMELAGYEAPLGFTGLRGADARDRWKEFRPEFFCNAPAVRLQDTTAEDFVASHSRLGRHSRRLRKQGVELRRYNGSNSGLVSWIYQQKALQEGSVFSDPRRREFMVRICAADPAACEIFTYESAAACVAALVTFRHELTRHFYTIYFNPQWAHYSPGQVLVFEATALSLADGVDCDYMTGEYPYKNRLATHTVPLYKVHASAARLAEIAELRPAPALDAA